nr:hypothetical protein [Tanacetum cinerariifolium]
GHGRHGGAGSLRLGILPGQFAVRCVLHQRTSVSGLGPLAPAAATGLVGRAGPSFRGRAGSSGRCVGAAGRRRLPRRARPGVGVAGALGGAAALGRLPGAAAGHAVRRHFWQQPVYLLSILSCFRHAKTAVAPHAAARHGGAAGRPGHLGGAAAGLRRCVLRPLCQPAGGLAGAGH